MFNVPRKDIGIRRDGNHIVLYYIPNEGRVATVKINNFMRGENYRHINLIDADGAIFDMGVGEDGAPFLADMGVLAGTDASETIKVSRTKVWVFAGEGENDFDISQMDADGGYVLQGGDNKDYLRDNDGDNTLIGGGGLDRFDMGAGNDIIITGRGTNLIYTNGRSGVKVVDTSSADAVRVYLNFHYDDPGVIWGCPCGSGPTGKW